MGTVMVLHGSYVLSGVYAARFSVRQAWRRMGFCGEEI